MKLDKRNKILKSGSALVEIVIGSAIMLVGIMALNSSYNSYYKFALANEKNIEADYLMEEGLEVFTYFRDKGWANISGLSTTTTYYLTYSTDWATTTTVQYVDSKFDRYINIFDVKRDANEDISVAGTFDANIKLITVTVSYFQGHATTTKNMSRYVANIK